MTIAPFLLALLCTTFTLPGEAQDAKSPASADRSGLAQVLSFEAEPRGNAPGGWNSGPAGTIFVDDKIVHGGRFAVRIERNSNSERNFSALNKSLPIDFAGKTIELRGFLRTEDVSEFAGLWLREDGTTPSLKFDNMENRHLKGTTGWTEYSITLPIQPEARQLVFGVLLSGTGKVWADDLQLLVDGKPIWEASRIERPKTALDLDHEFDGSSGVLVKELTNVQIENLATLGKVWGFLKYHHPKITSGQRHWDYDLFRILPAILAARNHETANTALLRWIDDLGAVAACNPCARLEENNLHLPPENSWISSETLLGKELSQRLRSIHQNRSTAATQFYLSLVVGVGNPSFQNELGYENLKFPDAGFQLLGLYRFWNIIEYWFPYRDVLGEDWDAVLKQFIPRIASAKNSDDYQRGLMALIATVHDTHANLWSSMKVRPPTGDCVIPVTVRFVENRPVISGYTSEAGSATNLRVGDIITELDGVPVNKLVESWVSYYGASNEPTRMRDIGRFMTRGDCVESTLRILRQSEALEVKAKRVPPPNPAATRDYHDLPGETFRLLSDDVAYIKLSSISVKDVKHYIESAAHTKGLIIDIRNYPSEFVVFELGSLLVEKKTNFVRFTEGDPANPGAFHWEEPLFLNPGNPHYPGKIVVMVDEITQSSAEYTSMAFRAAPHTTVVGSTTAGADGNVSPIPLPGGWRGMISGIGVFYPDKKPTQRIGIVPDVEVKPTIAGIRSGRDELLEEAIRQILGPENSKTLIEKMVQR